MTLDWASFRLQLFPAIFLKVETRRTGIFQISSFPCIEQSLVETSKLLETDGFGASRRQGFLCVCVRVRVRVCVRARAREWNNATFLPELLTLLS
jgi:hypothetical protein